MQAEVQVLYKQEHPNAKAPEYQTAGAACLDLFVAAVNGDALSGSFVLPGVPVVCDTGLSFEIPQDHVMLVFSRSGHGFKNDVRLANCVGVIDSDYRGVVKVKLTADETGSKPLFVVPGDRIGQALVIPIPRVRMVPSGTLSDTARGTGGLGSTGQ